MEQVKINGEIVEVVIDYFDEVYNQWCVDCFWRVNNPNDDKEYMVDEEWENRRGATMAYITTKGEVEYEPKFETFAMNDDTIQEAISDFCDECDRV